MALVRQHLIDPEICIRCNTCEETCPVNAITHNDENYVVDASICNLSLDCIAPCPTGAIDSFRMVLVPHSIDDQYAWEDLPEDQEAAEGPAPETAGLDTDAGEILDIAMGEKRNSLVPPFSAAHPYVNLYTRDHPATATVTGNFRITGPDAEADIRHIVLDFGTTAFPVLEGQSIGILPDGTDAKGRPHRMRLYSVASPRDGERPNHNNVALTVKRVLFDPADGQSGQGGGVASNYLCDLERGARVRVTGPYGDAFLMPNHKDANIIMVCTGTGAAPFRAMTEYRRRHMPSATGKLMLFFGARRPEELPYFGPLKKLPRSLMDQELVFSRLPDAPKEYVQDRMRTRAADLADLLRSDNTFLYICGLKGMETGVETALSDICAAQNLDWPAIKTAMEQAGRYHVETY
ncbi:MAG: benzoyl-CoA 2,3-epoxidase subunit BoxA [Magnetospiraceae bacterium]